MARILQRELRIQVVVEQTWQSGDRRNGEIRAHVLSGLEEPSKTEWLGLNRKGSSMTCKFGSVGYGNAVDSQSCLCIWMTIANNRVLRVTPRVNAR
ncbi:hypothetical protein IQ06DRAFT_222664 [Phaeosphaeriaceae sp. SRC1lsM3a]|nr:hypothetical protein IQ06DRAFT_222664 [Stagonospora sp. SRC1lsM3a]